jgi:diguanylate cyclase (GGDEF)-like protein
MARLNAKHSRIRKDAIVVTPGLMPCGCVIDGVVLEKQGLRLSLTDFSSPAVLDHLSSSAAGQADLHVFLDNDSEKQHLHYRGAVQAGRGSGISLEITGNTEELKNDIDRLLQHSVRNRTETAAPDPSLKQLYHQHCRRLLEQVLPEFMEGTFEGIEADLEQAAELREITRLKDMRFIFQSRQQRMLQDFQAQFQANQAILEPATESRAGSRELHLLQQHEFEDWLDLQAIATRISNSNTGATFLLNQFLNQIFRLDVNDDNNPLTPRALCVCLQYMVDHLGIAREHRLTIYRAWENALGRVWPAAIRSLINDCRRAGLEALDISELPANWSLREFASDDPGSTTETESQTPDETLETEDAGQATSEMSSAGRSLFQLMALEASPDSELAAWEEPNPRLSENLRSRRRELLNRLHDDEPDIAGLLQELADSDSDLASSLDRTAVEKANLVDRLFAPLKAHEELSGSLRHQLQKLRLPVFETLVETPDFLNADDHPARDIINNLMHICLAERASSKKLEATVAGIVEELTEIEVSDPELLEGLGQRLKQLVERQDQSFIRNSERLAKTLEGKERLRRTRKEARQRVNALLGGRQVPKVLIRLLQAGWEQLIVLTILREGPESRHCEELIDVVAQLQAWLSPADTSEELAFERELESSVMLQFIERELRTAGDVSRIRPVIDELSAVLQGHEEAETTWLEEYGDVDEVPLALPPELEDSRWVSRAKNIVVGDWVEVRLDSGETRRLRLVWGGEDSLRFVFLSPKGMSEVSYGFPEFVQKLAQGEAWLVGEGDIPFLDQSLFSIVEDVYRKLNFEATHDALTGCMHRHDFEKQVSQLINVLPLSAEDHGAALMVLDIDEFSVINASYGAEAGDTLLRQVADTLRHVCESRFSESHVGRISGNEFAVLINNISTEDCLDFAESLRRNFEQQVFQHGPAEYGATVSISI